VSLVSLVPRLVLGALLVAACVTDVRARRIPNALVAAVLGLAVARLAGAAWLGALGADASFAAGPGAAALGAATGLAVLLPFHALGMMGAGDVKLLAAAGAWLGPVGVLHAGVYTAFAGVLLAVAAVTRGVVAPRPPAPRAAHRAAHRGGLPYALAIAAGIACAVCLPVA
jgi:prepilin peptidase CpaA